jgi:hypothetical protein
MLSCIEYRKGTEGVQNLRKKDEIYQQANIKWRGIGNKSF